MENNQTKEKLLAEIERLKKGIKEKKEIRFSLGRQAGRCS